MDETEDNQTPETQSSAAGGPPRPPKKTIVGFDGEDDDLPELLRALNPEERRELAEWLKDYLGETGEQSA